MVAGAVSDEGIDDFGWGDYWAECFECDWGDSADTLEDAKKLADKHNAAMHPPDGPVPVVLDTKEGE